MRVHQTRRRLTPPTPPHRQPPSVDVRAPARSIRPIYKLGVVFATAAALAVVVSVGLRTPSATEAPHVTAGPPSATTAVSNAPEPPTPSVAGGASAPLPSGTLAPAQQGNAGLDAAAERVRTTVEDVLVTLRSVDVGQVGTSQLAISAQRAYEDLNTIKDSDADAFSNSADAGYEMYGAVNDLKNAMGTLIAYTSDPSPAMLAQFNAQWQAAVGRWNDGVSKVYAGSAVTAPTLPAS